MVLAHRIALAPNNKQATYLTKACGVARFAYNWALAEWQRQYEAHKQNPALPKPTEISLCRQLNAIKREQFPWMLEVTKCAPQYAIMQLGEAFKHFWAGRAKYPQFRKKGRDDRFTLSNDQFRVAGRRIQIPKLGWVRMREPLRFSGKLLSATVSRVADRWYVSITVETNDPPKRQAENQGAVGVDLGVSVWATLSTGEQFAGPKPLEKLLQRLRLLSRRVSRKQKGSANRKKAVKKLAQLHARIAHVRLDATHQLTADLTRRFHTICIEDLNVQGMMQNRRLARVIADMSFYEFRRQLEYKAARRGGQVVVLDRWYPSSKTCSACGHRLDTLSLATRQWTCPACNTRHDRDVNAAKNILVAGLAALSSPTASSAGSHACGEEGAGHRSNPMVKPCLDEAGSQLRSCLSRNE